MANALSSVFRTYLITAPLRILLTIFIIVLVVGPILLMITAFFVHRQSLVQNRRWVPGLRGYGRFWLALIVAAALQVALVVGYLFLNPYVRNLLVYREALLTYFLRLYMPTLPRSCCLHSPWLTLDSLPL
jgi:hypothetical protein